MAERERLNVKKSVGYKKERKKERNEERESEECATSERRWCWCTSSRLASVQVVVESFWSEKEEKERGGRRERRKNEEEKREGGQRVIKKRGDKKVWRSKPSE